MKLYSLSGNGKVVTVDVIKETPKGYKLDQESCEKWKDGWHVPKFLKKADLGFTWFPARIMAIKYMREILKKRIISTDEAMYRAKQSKVASIEALKDFDSLNNVVNDDNLSEESYWMELQRKEKMAQLLPEEHIRVWCDETLVWYDGPQLAVLRAEDGQKYLSIWVDEKGDDLIYLCVPVSEKELKDYKDYQAPDTPYNIPIIYVAATRFYTNSYEDFDSDTYLLKPINKEDIPKDWWLQA